MELSGRLLKKFAKTTNDNSRSDDNVSYLYGEIVVSGDSKYVQLDGASSLTPVVEATDAQEGDRVMVTLTNHTASVVGNISCPASARTASSYIRLTEEGLLVGELDSTGNVVGTGSLIAPGTYYIIDTNGNKVASFSLDGVRFCGDKCRIYSTDDEVMVLYSDNAVGMRTVYTDASGGEYRSEVVCLAKDTQPAVSMQAYKKDGDISAYVSVSAEDGVALVGDKATYNGDTLLTSQNLICTGKITATGSVKAGGAATVSKAVTLPTGYVLAGISEITTNHTQNCVITRMFTDISTGTVGVRLRNLSESAFTDLTVTIQYFALYSNGPAYTVDDVLEFTEDE